MPDALLLPPGARLIHIGPHKTGTTALQHALHRSRPALLEQGVVYGGSASQAYLAAHGLTGQPRPAGAPPATEQDWLELVNELGAAGDRRALVSSEAFAAAGPEQIERLANDVGRDRVHVVRMVRRYDKLLPSQWQQLIRSGRRRPSVDRWAAEVLANPAHEAWNRHRFARLTRRWADVVGPDRVSVVVVDESDPEWSLRVFERFLGLTPGTLGLAAGKENRSPSLGEVEMLRRFNTLRRREGWPAEIHLHYVLRSVLPALQDLPTDPKGGRIELPVECHEALREITRRDVEELVGLGVRIVGDLRLLHPPTEMDGHLAARRPTRPPSVGAGRAAAVAATVVDRGLQHPLRLTGASLRAAGDASTDPRPHRVLLPPTGEKDDGRLPEKARVGLYLQRDPAVSFIGSALDGLVLVDDPATRDDQLDHVVVPVAPAWQSRLGAWQQHLLVRGVASFPDWLHQDPARRAEVHPLAGLVDRFGAERLVVLPADGCDPEGTLQRLVALTGQQIVTSGPGARSLLAWSEAELLRHLNLEASTRGWEDEAWLRYVRDGVVRLMLTRAPARRGRIPLGGGDLAQSLNVATERLAAAVESSRVRVFEGPQLLRAGFPLDLKAGGQVGEARVAAPAAALALAGAIGASLVRG